MTSVRFALLLAGGLILGAGNATAEPADCRAQLQRQDEQCQGLAEKLATACPSGTRYSSTGTSALGSSPAACSRPLLPYRS